MDLELKEVATDHPDVGNLTKALGAEVVARGANAGDSEAEAERPIREVLEPDSDVLVAYLGQEAVGIGALRRLDPETGEIKRMYVEPDHRGSGIGRQLVVALEERALHRGFRAVRLDTHDRLGEAGALYTSMGYREIPDYNGNPSANRWFEKRLA